MADYTVRVITRPAGAAAFGVDGTLEDATVKGWSLELNRPGSATFSIPVDHAHAADVMILDREVEILRAGVVLIAGPVVTVRVADDQATYQMVGRGWYFDRLFIGKADRTNFLANPEFEAGLTGWTAIGGTVDSVSSTQRVLGTQSLKLVQAAGNQDAYESQIISVVGTGVGSLYTLAGWFYIEDAGWLGGAANKWGMLLTLYEGGVIARSGVFHIDGKTPRGVWQRAEATVWVPPLAADDLEARLYSPGGTIYWDALSLTLMESLSFFDADIADIAAGIVAHLQDPAFGKTDLGITTDCPSTGETIQLQAYQFADHHNGGRALRDLTERENGVDWAVGLDKVFRTYFPHKGDYHLALAVTITEISTWNLQINGVDACSSVTILGEGAAGQDGPDREEGAAIDAGRFAGLILEDVTSAPVGATIDSLDARAAEELAARDLTRSLQLVLPAEGYAGVITEGDSLPVSFSEGFVTVVGDWRAIRISGDGVEDSITLDLVPA